MSSKAQYIKLKSKLIERKSHEAHFKRKPNRWKAVDVTFVGCRLSNPHKHYYYYYYYYYYY